MSHVMLRAGLLGSHIQRSLSPILHQAAAAHFNNLANYELFDISPDSLSQKLPQLMASDLHGFNVTAPFKVDVLNWLQKNGQLSEIAQAVGSVNTVILKENQKPLGENTDVDGVRAAIEPWILAGSPGAVAVLGNGGAARAVLYTIQKFSKEIRVLSRKQDQKFAESFGATAYALNDTKSLKDVQLVVNTLPPAADEIAVSLLQSQPIASDAFVLDLGYGERPLIALAQSLHLHTSDGLRFLAAQGVSSFSLWTHELPPLEKVLTSLRSVQLTTLLNHSN